MRADVQGAPPGREQELPSDTGLRAPSIQLPKGGGAIRGIGEKFAANPVTGTGSLSVPIFTSPGRSGFSPQLALTYDSGAGNGPFGFGWNLSLPSITRKTEKGLPQYRDAEESDVFTLSGAEDLTPVLVRTAPDSWARERLPLRTVNGMRYRIDRYRPRIEGLFARIERWTNITDTADVFWRSISRDNITTWYGRTPDSRIADPADAGRIFSWLICQSHDDKGNVIVYGYKAEDSAKLFVDATGKPLTRIHERNRTPQSRSAQRYLKRIRYGNRSPYFPELKADAAWPEPPEAAAADGSMTWHFEAVFDYGEHEADPPLPQDAGTWPARPDPFSSCRAGFEIRTYRLCRRVLMFHHFPEEAGVERNCLVRSTDFGYPAEADSAGLGNAGYTFLENVTQTGYRRTEDGYDLRGLPPVAFEYTRAVVQTQVEELDPASLENLPIGLDGNLYRWTDLHGEGLPGIFTEQAGAWFYKRNLGPLADTARLGPLETVALEPNLALQSGAELMDLAGDGLPDLVMMEGPMPGLYEHDETEGWQRFRPFLSRLNRDVRDPDLRFIDLDGDGRADILITGQDAFVWHASLAENGFGPARRVAQALDEEHGPRLVFSDRRQSVFLADMNGDGLTDLVRISNGEICYWPNLGYCRFGARVTMRFEDEHGQAACFDHGDQFDHRRIRLADIDGSGTTDIIYLHRDGVRLYFNQSGNGWSLPQVLAVFPRVDDLVSMMPTDLLGNGTACLVWSSPLPADSRRQMRYVNLMGGRKPHLLVRVVNNRGAETRIDYASSTRFYLQDKRDGKPWITRLPFPVHVVERVETWDHISRNRFITRYAYHHGHFDGEEREFRGFGMVEQWDTEQIPALAEGRLAAGNLDAASHVPPVHTKTWFHTGLHLGREHVADYFAGLADAGGAGEYFREPGLTSAQARSLLLPDTTLPDALAPDEEREACRALKGSMLRQEIYADDAGHPGATPEQIRRARTPYSVVEKNFTVRLLQPRGANRHAVFLTHASEVLTYHYERNPADPRIAHALTLEVDDYGNVRKQAAIGYGRRAEIRTLEPDASVTLLPNPGFTGFDAADKRKQTTPLITYTENRFTRDSDTGTDAIERDDVHRAPLPCETVTYELTDYPASGPELGPATDPARRMRRYLAADFVETDPALPGRLRHRFDAPELAYEATAAGSRRRRPIERLRTLYRRNDLSGLLPLGDLQALALPGESYRLAFTPGLLDQAFLRPRQEQADEPLLPAAARAALLGGQSGSQGGYVDLDGNGHWWVPSGRSFYHPDEASAAVELAEARAHFFLPRRYRDPFGKNTTVSFDGPADPAKPRYDLLVAETRDALGNRVTVDANDYRVLQPRRVSDPNRNQTEVAFDILGMVVGTAVMGKPPPAPPEGDSLAGFVTDLAQAQRDSLFGAADPRAMAAELLQGATLRIVYDLDRFRRTQQAHPGEPEKWLPACAAMLARETHVHAPLPPQGLKLQISILHSDGFGREIQKKMQAEPGPVPLRDANGGIVMDDDGHPRMTPDAHSPRWVGSGWTVFNNKGKPVRQYEPFFTDTHRFESDVRIGVSAVLFYDPLERVIATLHPNHTYEKVKFDPWRQTAWDVNDTCAARNAQTGDPRTDPDIGGYVAAYFRTQAPGWQTWYARRIGAALGTDEQHAAERAAAHADTPATAHVDALGRPFLTIVRNRIVCAEHPLDGLPDEESRTRIELDIEGNQRRVFDERKLPDAANLPLGALEQRIVMQYACDMLGNRIGQSGMEGGARWQLNDAAGKPIRTWDSRGHNITMAYDALRRPIAQSVRGTFSDPDPLKPNSDPRTLNPPGADGLLVDRIEYGEPPPGATEAEEARARRLNLRTRIYRHFDSAGIVTHAGLDVGGQPSEAYDFKGNPLRGTRQLVSDYKAIPDWLANPPLDAETFESSTRYDALNRPVQSVAPHSSLGRGNVKVIQPVFNAANLPERVDVWLERAAEPGALLDPANEAASPVGVARIDYDAKGQRTLVDCKTREATVIRTTCAYDRDTSLLTHLYTRRGVDPATAQGVRFPDDCDNPDPPPATLPAPATPPAGKGCGLQNLHYTYDPAGNITHIRDDAQQTLYFRNQRVEPHNDYVYDALYRLIQASGREHLGQLASGERLPPTAPDAFNAFPLGQDQPNVRKAMGAYTERYVHDAVGNFLRMQHRGTDPAHPGWTRDYTYAENSLTEPGKRSNRLSHTMLNPAGDTPQPETCLHDVHGNMVRMPHLTRMDWDYRNRLQATSRQVINDTPPPDKLQQTTFHVYDSSGQRVRKVCEKAPGLTEERLYLGGFEIFRRHGGAAGADVPTLERETLHVMDGARRIALVEMRTAGNEPGIPPRAIRYAFGNHLGSASLELDDQAHIVSYEEYAPYGSSTYQAVRSQTETAKRYRHAGKERDEESGLYYYGARHYAPWLGRWVSCDPSGVLNLYSYCAGNPIRLVDPDGREERPPEMYQAQVTGKETPEQVKQLFAARGIFYNGNATWVPTAEGGYWHLHTHQIQARDTGKQLNMRADPVNAPRPGGKPAATGPSNAEKVKAIRERRQQDWEAARAGMYNTLVDTAAMTLQMTPLDPLSRHLLNKGAEAIKADKPAATGDYKRDAELKENYEQGEFVANTAIVAVTLTPVGEIAEGAQLAAGKLPKPSGGLGMAAQEFTSSSKAWAAKEGMLFHEHHVFPQELEAEFKALGIDVHDYTIRIPAEQHMRLHTGGVYNWEFAEFFYGEGAKPTKEGAKRLAVELLGEHGVVLDETIQFRRYSKAPAK